MSELTTVIREQIEKHGKGRESLMPILQSIVEKNNYLTNENMVEIAKELDISAADVYGTASFYSFLETEERGKYVIRVCKSITCDMKGKGKILSTLEGILKIKLGETTQNKKFSLLETNCIGLCDQGPAMLINDEYYNHLTPEKVRTIIGDYIRNKN
ncbi:MAG: NAD(P)H-dependent oxidoreductase subunit E [Saprospiraceae bacterium]|nr:NAD(P)H-dependent oxidoreductase subunit E [Saprospiraceae bacterium]